jgi:hypothetical protein
MNPLNLCSDSHRFAFNSYQYHPEVTSSSLNPFQGHDTQSVQNINTHTQDSKPVASPTLSRPKQATPLLSLCPSHCHMPHASHPHNASVPPKSPSRVISSLTTLIDYIYLLIDLKYRSQIRWSSWKAATGDSSSRPQILVLGISCLKLRFIFFGGEGRGFESALALVICYCLFFAFAFECLFWCALTHSVIRSLTHLVTQSLTHSLNC